MRLAAPSKQLIQVKTDSQLTHRGARDRQNDCYAYASQITRLLVDLGKDLGVLEELVLL